MHSDVNYLKIATHEFSPTVLKCSHYTDGMQKPQGFKLEERIIFDYELEFIIESSGGMMIENQIYPIRPGEIVFRKPGQLAQGILPYSCYFIGFDLLSNTGKSSSDYDFRREQAFQNYYINPVIDAIPSVFSPSNPDKYQRLFSSILKEFIFLNEISILKIRSILLEILYEIYLDITSPLSSLSMLSSPYYSMLKKAISFMEENYSEKLDLKTISTYINLSPNYFHKIFKNTIGVTPNEYLTSIRLDKAKELLIQTDLPISSVAQQCGFENIPYFSFVFDKQTRISPMGFRKKHKNI